MEWPLRTCSSQMLLISRSWTLSRPNRLSSRRSTPRRERNSRGKLAPNSRFAHRAREAVGIASTVSKSRLSSISTSTERAVIFTTNVERKRSWRWPPKNLQFGWTTSGRASCCSPHSSPCACPKGHLSRCLPDSQELAPLAGNAVVAPMNYAHVVDLCPGAPTKANTHTSTSMDHGIIGDGGKGGRTGWNPRRVFNLALQRPRYTQPVCSSVSWPSANPITPKQHRQ